MNFPVCSGILLGLAVALAIVCSVGMLVMREPLQRLHFSAPVVFFSGGLIALAVWLESSDPQARIKVLLTWVILFVMSSILMQATARAIFISRTGKWDLPAREHIPITGRGKRAPAHSQRKS